MSHLFTRLRDAYGADVLGLLGFLAIVLIGFSIATPQFLSLANFNSIAFQLPVLGLLTLAMLPPTFQG